jgi:hypothetical protein
VSTEPATDSSPEPAPARTGAGSSWPLIAASCVLLAALFHSATPNAAPLSATVRAGPVARYAEGAPAGFSGGFAEQSCHACHFQADVNTGSGTITITGVPERFVAGERYLLTITLTRPGMAIGGFQLTARLKDGGAQAGTLSPPAGESERVTIDAQSGIQYASQRRPGTALVARDTARWTVEWTAPNANGTVLFHVAANAADNDASAQGDYIHTAMVTTDAAGGPTRR